MTQDEMVGWHHRLDVHEFGYTLGAGDRQGSLVCCNPGDYKELDTTELKFKLCNVDLICLYITKWL